MTVGTAGRHRRVTTLGAVMCLMATGCVSAISVAPTPSAAPSAAPATDICRPIDMRTPTGERVNLTGTWEQLGDRNLFYVYQDADCVWIVGNFVAADDDAGFGNLGEATLLAFGHLRPDFTVHGQWAILRYVTGPEVGGPYQSGVATWELDLGGDRWTLRADPPDDLGEGQRPVYRTVRSSLAAPDVHLGYRRS